MGKGDIEDARGKVWTAEAREVWWKKKRRFSDTIPPWELAAHQVVGTRKWSGDRDADNAVGHSLARIKAQKGRCLLCSGDVEIVNVGQMGIASLAAGGDGSVEYRSVVHQQVVVVIMEDEVRVIAPEQVKVKIVDRRK